MGASSGAFIFDLSIFDGGFHSVAYAVFRGVSFGFSGFFVVPICVYCLFHNLSNTRRESAIAFTRAPAGQRGDLPLTEARQYEGDKLSSLAFPRPNKFVRFECTCRFWRGVHSDPAIPQRAYGRSVVSPPGAVCAISYDGCARNMQMPV